MRKPPIHNIPLRTKLGGEIRRHFTRTITEDSPLGLISYEEMETRVLAAYMQAKGFETVEEALDDLFRR